MTPLRQRVLDELQRRNYSPATSRGYIPAISSSRSIPANRRSDWVATRYARSSLYATGIRRTQAIQLLMGHAHLGHTPVYLHLSQRHLHAAPNPPDQITVRGCTEWKRPPQKEKA